MSSRLHADHLRAEFLRLLTVDGTTKDRRRKGYNQAIFDPEEGWAVWSSTDLGMVMDKFDRAVKAVQGAPPVSTCECDWKLHTI